MLVLPLVDSTDVVSVVSSGAASDTSVSDAAVSDASVVSGAALSDTGVVSPHPVSNAADIINAEIITNKRCEPYELDKKIIKIKIILKNLKEKSDQMKM